MNALATGGVITAGEFARNTLTRPDMSTGNTEGKKGGTSGGTQEPPVNGTGENSNTVQDASTTDRMPQTNNQYCLSGAEHYEAYKEMFGEKNVEWVSRDSLSSADRLRIKDWKFKPSDELYIKYKSVYQNDLYFNRVTGEIRWPNDDGFRKGTLFKRYGDNSGEFLGNTSDTYESRALAPYSENAKVHYYVLTEDYRMTSGEAAPWFGSNGGAEQFVKYKQDGTKYSIKELQDLGILKELQIP